MSIRSRLNNFARRHMWTPTNRGRRPQRQGIRKAYLETLEGRALMSFSPAVGYPAGANPQAVASADLNGDGRLDLAVANYSDGTVSVLLGNAGGTFQAALTAGAGAGPRSI